VVQKTPLVTARYWTERLYVANITRCMLYVCTLSIYLWVDSPLLDLDRLFGFLIFYTVDRTLWAMISPSQYVCELWNLNVYMLTHRIPSLKYSYLLTC
jgi:hypothetical protein